MASIKGKNIDVDDPIYRISPYQQMIASCTGALITSVFVTPLDVVKIRLQTQQKAMLSNKCYLYCNGLMDHICSCANGKGGISQAAWIKANGKFNGTLDALVKISRQEGILSLWSGLSPTLVLAVPATIVYFVSYEQIRFFLKDRHNAHRPNNTYTEQPFWIPMVAGGTARIWAATLVSPLELIRTKMQSQKLSYGEINQALKMVIKYNGVRGLWMGLGSTLLRDVPFSAIYWFNYENIKKNFSGSQPSFAFNFAAGAIAGSIAAFITIPFDVVKTHKQIEMGEKQIYSDSPKESSSTLSIIKKIYSQGGVKSLFTGLVPRLVKVAPACALMISTFEYGKCFFLAYNINQACVTMKPDIHCINQSSNKIINR